MDLGYISGLAGWHSMIENITNVSEGTLVEDTDERPRELERASSVSEEYMRYLDNPQNVEKRFPVDRRKLEELITGRHCEANLWDREEINVLHVA